MKTRKRKRVWSVRAKDKTHLKVWLWLVPPPVKNPRDVIEIDLKTKYLTQRIFLEPWEVSNLVSGMFLALLEYDENLAIKNKRLS